MPGDLGELKEIYPLCAAVQSVLAEYMTLEPTTVCPLDPVLRAYDCTDGCIDEGFWSVEELDMSIIKKFKYAIRGVCNELVMKDVEIVVEPNCEDTTSWVAIRGDQFVYDYCKPWNFGHRDGSLRDLEEEFEVLAGRLVKLAGNTG
jgi:hypothetical protein